MDECPNVLTGPIVIRENVQPEKPKKIANKKASDAGKGQF
jgi:hypothetical protein